MRSADAMLEALGTTSETHPDYVFHRVYRNLFNRDLFLRAYLKLAPNEGNMTKGTDGKTIDGFGMALIALTERRNDVRTLGGQNRDTRLIIVRCA